MLKKFLSIISVTAVMFTVIPATLPVSAETDPEGTIIVMNDTATTDDPRFIPYNNPAGGVVQTVGTHGAGKAYEESLLKGYNDSTPLQLLTVGHGAWYTLTATTDSSLAGTYDIYIYNVCEGTDTRRGSTTHPDYYAQYNVVSANGEARYFIDQKNASGGRNGWVKLGTHYFSGSSGERVAVSKNYQNNSSTYLSAVKFVLVNKPSSAKITHMYMKYNGTRVEADDTVITGNTVIKQFPADYSDATKKIALKFETEDPDAQIKFDWSASPSAGSIGTELYANPEATNHYNLIVTSQDGTVTENYRVAIGVDNAVGVKYYSVGGDNYTSSYGTGSYDDEPSSNGWNHPTELATKKSI